MSWTCRWCDPDRADRRLPADHAVLRTLSARTGAPDVVVLPGITRRLAGFEIDMAMTYLDGEEDLGEVRVSPLHEERYLLLTPSDGELADRRVARWAEVAALPLCLLAPEMRNRRILDANFRQAGAVAVPATPATSGIPSPPRPTTRGGRCRITV